MMETNQVIMDTVREWVQLNKPFALLRFGDGEGLFANLYGSHPNFVKACVKHWGHIPSRVYRMRIEKSIKDAYFHCDIAGLPYDLNSSAWRSTLCQFLVLPTFNKQLKCSAIIHLDFDVNGFIGELVNGRNVVYVGCRDITEKMKEMGALKTTIIKISEQYKFATEKPLEPFYKQVDDIQLQLRRMNLTGSICLLGAGVAGKYVGIVMRERGGMVLDIGSVVDKWAGVKSRSWIK